MALLGKAERVTRLTLFYQIELPDTWEKTDPENADEIRAVLEGSEIDQVAIRWLFGSYTEEAAKKHSPQLTNEPGYWKGLRELSVLHGDLHAAMDAIADGVAPERDLEYGLSQRMKEHFGPPRIHWEGATVFRAEGPMGPMTEIVHRPGLPSKAEINYRNYAEDVLSGEVPYKVRLLERYLLQELIDAVLKEKEMKRCEECESVFVLKRARQTFCSDRCSARRRNRLHYSQKKEVTP